MSIFLGLLSLVAAQGARAQRRLHPQPRVLRWFSAGESACGSRRPWGSATLANSSG
jgi:hypothetical protein